MKKDVRKQLILKSMLYSLHCIAGFIVSENVNFAAIPLLYYCIFCDHCIIVKHYW